MKKKLVAIICMIAMTLALIPSTAFADEATPDFYVEGTLVKGGSQIAVKADGEYHYYKFTVDKEGLYYVASTNSLCDELNIIHPDYGYTLISGIKINNYSGLAEAWLVPGHTYYVRTISYNYSSNKYNIYLNQSPTGKYYIGDNVTMDIDSEGVMTVTGTGATWPFENSLFGALEDKEKRCKKIIIQEGVTDIPSYAFSDCYVESVTIPQSVTKIGECAFYYTSIEELELPSGLKSIEDEAFTGTKIKELSIPASVTKIGKNAFGYINHLKKVTLGSIPSIGAKAFIGCSELESFVNENGEPISANDLVSNMSKDAIGPAFADTPWMKNQSFNISGTFEGFNWVVDGTNLTISGSGKLMGNNYGFEPTPFSGFNTKNLVISNGVSEIENFAFSETDTLETISIGKDVTRIGTNAFQLCPNVETVIIPSTVKLIDSYAFNNDYKLKYIKDENGKDWDAAQLEKLCADEKLSLAFAGTAWIVGKEKQTGTYQNADCNVKWTIEDGVLTVTGSGKLTDLAIDDCPWKNYSGGVVKVVVGGGITAFDDSFAYSVNGDVKEIIMGDSVEEVTTFFSDVFDNWSNLEKVVFSANVKEISDYLMFCCNSVKEIQLPANLEVIGEEAFYNCKKVTNLTLPNKLVEIKDYAFVSMEGLTDITIPSSVKKIGGMAFVGCSSMRYISIPRSVESIGQYAFSGCDNLTTIVDENGVEYTIAEIEAKLADGADMTKSFHGVPWYNNQIKQTIEENETGTSDKSYTVPGYSENIILFTPAATAEYTISTGVKHQRFKVYDADSNIITDEKPSNGSIKVLLSEGVQYTISIDNQQENPVSYNVTIKGPSDCKKGHNYAAKYIWSDDYSKCTIKVRCQAGDAANEYTVVGSSLVKTPATCTSVGFDTYSISLICNEGEFSDEKILVREDMLGHDFSVEDVTKATLSAEGKIVKKCKNCGEVSGTKAINAAKTIKLSATTYTYDGKVKKPTVTVKDSAGNALKKDTDYTVTYASGRKAVGKYKVTIKGKGKYSFTKSLYFKINPVKTSITSLTKGTKALTVKWTKKATQTTGYEIQYSTSSAFKTGTATKKVIVKSNKTTSKTIKSLKAKKKYYVRVRTYKSVSGTKYYSAWCTKKSVTTK